MRMRIMMIATTCVAAALLITTLLTPSGAQAQSWSKYASAEDRFEAEFLGKVAKEPLALGTNAKALGLSRSTTYSDVSDDRLFMVAAALYESGSANLNRGAEAGFGAYKCQRTTTDKTLTYANGAAREIAGSGCFGIGAEVVTRWFQTGSWFHGAVVVIMPTSANRASAQRFLDSFKVTPP